MTAFSRLITISFLSSCVLLQGCQSVKKTLGIERDAPDEFAVTPSTQPLDMPPDMFYLPQPDPGAPRPQDVVAAQATKKKFLGDKITKEPLSPGQTALLKKTGAKEGQSKIRREIDAAAHTDTKANPVLKTLGIKESRGDTVDPLEEVKDLQSKGIPSPQPTEAK
jgi:hypothetical protein